MARIENSKEAASGSKVPATAKKQASCVSIAKRGLNTSNEYATLMAALLADLGEGTITPEVGAVMVKVGNSMLKVVEMQHRYGAVKNAQRSLQLIA